MTIYQIIDTLKQIASTQPSINSKGEGNIYEWFNACPEVKYASFFITQGQHQETEMFDRYALTLFYVDRLADDESNRIQIQSTGKEVLSNIINTFKYNFEADSENINYQPFTQRFNDMCAGIYASVVFEVEKESVCAEDFEFSVTPASGGKISIKNQVKSVKIRENGVSSVTYDSGYTGLSRVDIDVEVPTKKVEGKKTVDIKENGSKTISPSYGYDGIEGATINVNVPIPEFKTEELFAFENKVYIPTTDGYSKVTVRVPTSGSELDFAGTGWDTEEYFPLDVSRKSSVDSDLDYARQKFSEWDPANTSTANLYLDDFRLIYAPKIDTSNVVTFGDAFPNPTSGMFKGCTNLVGVPHFDTRKAEKLANMFLDCPNLVYVPLLDTKNATDMFGMFERCTSLTKVPHFNTSNVTNFAAMFQGCSSLTTVPQFDTRNAESMANIFNDCASLVSVPYFDTSKVTIISGMFHNCSSLETIPDFDFSNITQAGDYRRRNGAFSGCSKLKMAPKLNLGKCNDISYLFANCTSLTSVEIEGGVTAPGYKCVNIFQGVATTGVMKIHIGGGLTRDNYSKIISKLPATWTVEEINDDEKVKLQEKTATQNGDVLPDPGFDGMSKVTVALPIKNEERRKYTQNGTFAIDPAGGYKAFQSAIVTVDVPQNTNIQLNKASTLNENGRYFLHPDQGYDGVKEYEVNVDVPKDVKLRELTENITKNAFYEYGPGTGYDGFSYVRFTVNVPSKEPKLQAKMAEVNGIVLPDQGYDGLSQVRVNVPAKVFQTEEKTVSITSNGQTVIDKSTDKDGMTKVTVNVDVPQTAGGNLDLSGTGWETEPVFPVQVTRLSVLENDLDYTRQKYSEWDPATESSANLYENDNKLIYAPKLNTGKVNNMHHMFYKCSSLAAIPLFDTSKVDGMNFMFTGCSSLTDVPQFDTSNVITMMDMFWNCSSLENVPQFDTSRVKIMYGMFYGCLSLTSLPQLNTSNVTDMSEMFSDCSSLTEVPQFDTSNVTKMARMFNNCEILSTIPQFDTINVTDMGWMFGFCSNLTTVPLLDTVSVTDMDGCFTWCSNLTNLGGFLSLKANLDLSYSPKLTKESLMNVIRNLGQGKPSTLRLSPESKALLSPEDIAIATGKNWSIQ